MSNLPAGMHVYLYDSETGVNQDLQQSPISRVYLPAGEYRGRFMLKFSLVDLAYSSGFTEGMLAYCSGNDLRVKLILEPGETALLSVCNLTGQVMWQQSLTGKGLSEVNRLMATGLYLVSLYRSTGIQTQKVFVPSR
jgi:hypothetical protein